MEALQGMYGPSSIGRETNQVYNQFLRSPAFSSAYSELVRGASGARYRTRNALAGRGAPGAGISALSRSVGQGIAAPAFGQLYGNTWQKALEAVLQSMGQRSSAASYMSQRINWGDPDAPGNLEKIIGYTLYGGSQALPYIFKPKGG